jgi:Ca2+-binding RTX toxin-like protein
VASGNGDLIYGGFGSIAGTLNVTLTGANDTVNAGASSATVSASGDSDLIYGGFGSVSGGLNVLINGNNDTVIPGNSPATITGGSASNNLLVFGGAGSLDFTNGGGSATVFGGSGPVQAAGGDGALVFIGGTGGNTVTGGQGGTTLFGAASSNITYNGNAQGAVLVARDGNETLNGAGSSTNDTVFAGPGSATITGGSGSDSFLFFQQLTAPSGGAHIVITDFSSQDVVDLSGYGGNAAGLAIGAAVVSSGGTTLTLSDNTQISFLGVTSAGSLTGHVFSA